MNIADFKKYSIVQSRLTRKQCGARNYCSIAHGEEGRVIQTYGMNSVLVQFKHCTQWMKINELTLIHTVD